MKGFKSIAVLCGCLIFVVACVSNISTEKKSTEVKASSEVDLVGYMGRLQVYMNKLYFAGKAENKALFQFYLREMNELMIEISQAGVIMDGVNISSNMKAFGEPAIKVIEKRIAEEGFAQFQGHYENVVTACNSCHKVSKRGYLEIIVPKAPLFDNQNYNKGEYSDMIVDTDGD